MKEVVFDIEANGLQPDKIWCIVAKPLNEPVVSFGPDKIEKGIEYLQDADVLIGHNILGFDIPVIDKLYGVDLSKHKIKDTLVMSRLFNPVRENGHSLKTWGYIVGFPKNEQPEDWDSFSQDMLKYCQQDVILNEKVYQRLLKEGENFGEDSIALEHGVAEVLKQQEDNGFEFNQEYAMMLVAQLKERMFQVEKEVQQVFKPKMVDVKQVHPKLKKDGTLSKSGLTAEEYDRLIESGDYKPFMRQKLQPFNLGSRKQIGEYLTDFGWKPNRFTPTGMPIVDESSLAKVKNIPEARLIAEFLLLQKRIAQIDSWILAVQDDKRVHGFVIPNGTITGRMSHRAPNVAQVPSLASEYGKECRSCWTVKDGYKLVGIDASGLELRMLAHYMDDKEYTNEVTEGDIHTANQKAAGLKSRDQAKTFIYAFIYGAGDAKIGSVVGGNQRDGARLRKSFLDNNPSLKVLRDRVSRAAKRGYLKGLDGRKIFIRNEHAALNSLLQGGGAIVMKRALLMLQSLIKLNALDAKFVANIHDEWQMEVKEDIADFVGELAVGCIEKAGEYYDLRCPLTGEYKIGGDWSETH
jgi:DNA polymerase I-like protein with 3'-5' exonuclease and polymerase domains|tara:strand:- start:2103 stop:3836 length:1734 start_codon:yes stop_codon:yes gene_type:complete